MLNAGDVVYTKVGPRLFDFYEEVPMILNTAKGCFIFVHYRCQWVPVEVEGVNELLARIERKTVDRGKLYNVIKDKRVYVSSSYDVTLEDDVLKFGARWYDINTGEEV